MQIKDQKLVTWTEAKKVLADNAKEKEPGYEQKNALEHLQKFSKIAKANVEEMIEELRAFDKLKDRHIILIVNMLPQDPDDLRVLLGGDVTLSTDDKMKIIKIVKKHS